MKVCGGRGRSALFVGCVYMSTDSTSVARTHVMLLEIELVVCNGRKLVTDPEWARVLHCNRCSVDKMCI